MGADPMILSSAYDYSQIPYTSDTVDTSSDPFAGYYGPDLGVSSSIDNTADSSVDFVTGLPSTYSGAGSLLPVDLTGDSSDAAGSSVIPFGGVIHTTSTASMPRTASSSNLIWLILLAVGGFYLFESRRKK